MKVCFFFLICMHNYLASCFCFPSSFYPRFDITIFILNHSSVSQCLHSLSSKDFLSALSFFLRNCNVYSQPLFYFHISFANFSSISSWPLSLNALSFLHWLHFCVLCFFLFLIFSPFFLFCFFLSFSCSKYFFQFIHFFF